MQVAQWGAAASVTSGVRSIVTLNSRHCLSNFLCTFLPTLASRQLVKKSQKICTVKLSNRSTVRINRFQSSMAIASLEKPLSPANTYCTDGTTRHSTRLSKDNNQVHPQGVRRGCKGLKPQQHTQAGYDETTT